MTRHSVLGDVSRRLVLVASTTPLLTGCLAMFADSLVEAPRAPDAPDGHVRFDVVGAFDFNRDISPEASRVLDGFDKHDGRVMNELRAVISFGLNRVHDLAGNSIGGLRFSPSQRSPALAKIAFDTDPDLTQLSRLPRGRLGLAGLLGLQNEPDVRWKCWAFGQITFPDGKNSRIGVLASLRGLVEVKTAAGEWREARLNGPALDHTNAALVASLIGSYPAWLTRRYGLQVTPERS